MANNIAFQPMGKTYEVTAGATANNKSITTDNSSNQYFIVNSSSTDNVFVRITPGGGNAAVANAAGTYGFTVLPRDSVVITGPQVNPNFCQYYGPYGGTTKPEPKNNKWS